MLAGDGRSCRCSTSTGRSSTPTSRSPRRGTRSASTPTSCRSACRSCEACERAGVTVEAYLAHYDPTAVLPFAGVAELLAGLDRWGLASNKERASGRRELERLGWHPDAALFSDDFGGREKELAPAARRPATSTPSGVVFVGDTRHDRACAAAVGARFALAGWNPRARATAPRPATSCSTARRPARPARTATRTRSSRSDVASGACPSCR